MSGPYVYIWSQRRFEQEPVPRYVGMSKHSPDGKNPRHMDHWRHAQDFLAGKCSARHATPFVITLAKAIRNGTKHHWVVRIEQCASEAEARALEKHLVEKHGRKALGTGTLLNVVEGGGASPMNDPLVRAKFKKTLANPEVKARYSAANKKAHASAEVRARHSVANKQAHARPDVKARHSAAMTRVNADPVKRAVTGHMTSIGHQRRRDGLPPLTKEERAQERQRFLSERQVAA
jgi:hypothetical protein